MAYITYDIPQADLKLEKEQYDQERHEKERARDTLVQRAQRLRDDIVSRPHKTFTPLTQRAE